MQTNCDGVTPTIPTAARVFHCIQSTLRFRPTVGYSNAASTTPAVWAMFPRRWALIVLNVTIVSLAMAVLTWPARHIYIRGHNDFLSFYAGGKLAFTDQLYDPPTVAAVQETHSGTAGPALRFIRLPFYAVALSVLSVLPYMPAYVLWELFNVLCSIGAVVLWPADRYRFAQVTSVCVPLYWSFLNGQDIGLLLLFVVLAIRWFSASSLLPCLIKFHFLWLTPITLPRRTWVKSVMPTAALLFIPLIWHPTWPVNYYQAVIHGRSVISHVPISVFPYAGWCGLVVAAFAMIIIVRRCNGQVAFSSGVALAVVVSPHAYFQDYSLAIPIAAFMWERVRSSTQRPW
jgi:hypothetical protein